MAEISLKGVENEARPDRPPHTQLAFPGSVTPTALLPSWLLLDPCAPALPAHGGQRGHGWGRASYLPAGPRIPHPGFAEVRRHPGPTPPHSPASRPKKDPAPAARKGVPQRSGKLRIPRRARRDPRDDPQSPGGSKRTRRSQHQARQHPRGAAWPKLAWCPCPPPPAAAPEPALTRVRLSRVRIPRVLWRTGSAFGPCQDRCAPLSATSAFSLGLWEVAASLWSLPRGVPHPHSQPS